MTTTNTPSTPVPTVLTLNEFLNTGRADRLIDLGSVQMYKPNPRLYCKDGYSVSIQCSYYNYCEPRENLADCSLYTSFELGFPDTSDELLDEYAEDDGELLDTVYPYVPREVVEALIAKHGGIEEASDITSIAAYKGVAE